MIVVLNFPWYQYIIHESIGCFPEGTYHLYSLLALVRVQVLGVDFGKEIVMKEANWVNYPDRSIQLEFIERPCIFLAAGILINP